MGYPDENVNLIQQACKGDAHAFGRLADNHYRTVYGVAFSAVGNWSAAQDIAQETFLLAWLRRDSLRNALAFPAWLRRIAGNLAKNWLRSADYRRRLAEHYQAVTPPEAPSHTEPDAQADASLRRDEVWVALETLPAKLREAVVLYYLHGETLRGVAGALGITQNAAQKRIEYGRAKLRAHFEERWKNEMAQARATLEAHSAKERFLAGVALGPAAPGLAKGIAGSGLGLWWEAAKQGAFVQKALLGGITMTANKSILIAVVCVVAVSGAYWATAKGANRPAVAPSQLASSDPAGSIDSTMRTSEKRSVAATPAAAAAKPDVSDGQMRSSTTESAPNPPPKLELTTPTEIPNPKDYASVAGTVVDENNVPVSGAQVTVVALGIPEYPKSKDKEFAAARRKQRDQLLADRTHYYSGVSDETGAFVISNIKYAGEGLASARAPEHRAASTESFRLSAGSSLSDVKLQVRPGTTIHGRVQDKFQRPIVDATLQVIGYAGITGSHSGGSRICTFVDATGGFELSVDSAGAVSILSDSPSQGSVTFRNVEIDPAQELLLTYPDATVVFGRVEDENKKPLPNVEVRLTGIVTTEYQLPDGVSAVPAVPSQGSVSSITTDENGAYRFARVDPDQRYQIAVFGSTSDKLLDGPYLDNLKPGTQTELNLAVHRLMTVKGKVYARKSRQPMPGVEIQVSIVKRSDPTSLASGPEPVETAEDGSYSISLTGGGGEFTFLPIYPWATKIPNGQKASDPKTIEIKPGDTVTLDFHMPDTVTRSFLVVDEAGGPIKGVALSLMQSFPRATPNDSTSSDTDTYEFCFSSSVSGGETTGADGRITSSMLTPEMEFSAWFQKEGYVHAEAPAKAGQPGEVFPEETVVMYRRGGMLAILVGPDGAPLANQDVSVVAKFGDQREHTTLGRGRTNADGMLTIGELPATQTALQFTIASDRNGTKSTLNGNLDSATINAGEPTDVGRITMSPVGKGK